MKLAVILKGVTFLRAAGTLIHFAQERQHDLIILYAATRVGREYDNLNPAELQQFAPRATLVPFTSESEIVRYLTGKNIQVVIAQDPYNHFPEVCAVPQIRVYGISVFIDTLHYAWRVKQRQQPWRPIKKIYFPCTYIKEKFLAYGAAGISQFKYATLGSPLLDHVLFTSKVTTNKVLAFIVPPPDTYRFGMQRSLQQLLKLARQRGFKVVAKDRVKTPLKRSLYRFCDEIQTTETFLPYASMGLLAQSTFHLCGYSTSVFEARFLNLPTLNLDINLRKVEAGDLVARYGLQDLYNSQTCFTRRYGLSQAFLELIEKPPDTFMENKRFIEPNQPTIENNASLRILDDILYEENAHG